MTVRRFRTKIVEIEAMQYVGNNLDELKEWTEGNFRDASGPYIDEETGRTFDTLVNRGEVYDKLHTTWIKVSVGQWIVRGAKGEFYPCDNETFHWKYEEVVPTGKVKLSVDRPSYIPESLFSEAIIPRNEARKMNGVEEV